MYCVLIPPQACACSSAFLSSVSAAFSWPCCSRSLDPQQPRLSRPAGDVAMVSAQHENAAEPGHSPPSPAFPYTQGGVHGFGIHPVDFGSKRETDRETGRKERERNGETEREEREERRGRAGSTMSGGSSELVEVQEKLELLNIEYDRLNDELTGRIAAQQDEFQREKYVRRISFAAAPS